jgi:hypothetical protein
VGGGGAVVGGAVGGSTVAVGTARVGVGVSATVAVGLGVGVRGSVGDGPAVGDWDVTVEGVVVAAAIPDGVCVGRGPSATPITTRTTSAATPPTANFLRELQPFCFGWFQPGGCAEGCQ